MIFFQNILGSRICSEMIKFLIKKCVLICFQKSQIKGKPNGVAIYREIFLTTNTNENGQCLLETLRINSHGHWTLYIKT